MFHFCIAEKITGKYKEVWIGLGGVQSAVYATEVSVPEYLAYTTEETEKVEVQRLAGELAAMCVQQLFGEAAEVKKKPARKTSSKKTATATRKRK